MIEIVQVFIFFFWLSLENRELVDNMMLETMDQAERCAVRDESMIREKREEEKKKRSGGTISKRSRKQLKVAANDRRRRTGGRRSKASHKRWLQRRYPQFRMSGKALSRVQ